MLKTTITTSNYNGHRQSDNENYVAKHIFRNSTNFSKIHFIFSFGKVTFRDCHLFLDFKTP